MRPNLEQAGFPKTVARAQDGNRVSVVSLGGYRELHVAMLNPENRIPFIALAIDFLPLFVLFVGGVCTEFFEKPIALGHEFTSIRKLVRPLASG